jgi:tetratricopeptide (TPR) repeat protein
MQSRSFFRICLCLLFFVTPHVWAATKVSATVSSPSLSVGESFDLEIHVEGAVRADQPAAPEVDGFEYRGTSQSSQMSIIGSEVRQRVTYTFRYVARKEGTFTIPAVDVVVGGNTSKTDPITVTVKAAMKSQGAGDFAFAKIEPLKKSAYIGEDVPVEISAFFDLSARWNIGNKPQLTAEGFNTRDIAPGGQTEQEIGGKRYGRVTYRTVVTPSKAGNLKLGDATLVTQYSKQRGRGLYDPMFGGFGRAEELEVVAPAVEFEVKPLPIEGRPKDFSGAVGKFTFSGSGTPAKVKIGEPITMTLIIQGQGNFDRITLPPLAEPDGWNAYDSENNFERRDDMGLTGVKTFRLPVSPLAQKTTVPVFAFTYFDPEGGKYVTLKNDASPLTVEGMPVAPAPVAAGDPAAVAPAPAPEAKPDLLPNLPAPGKTLQFRKSLTPGVLFGAVLAPLPILLGLVAWRSRKSDPLADSLAELSKERTNLMSLIRRTDSRDELFDAAGRILQIDAAIARRSPGTSFDDAELLASRQLDERSEAAVRELMASRSQLLFAGGGGGEKVSSVERDRVLDTLSIWERCKAQAGTIRVIALLFFGLCTLANAGDFENANAAFAEGKFEDAKRGYERALADGWQAGALFNLGNTYYRLDQPGRAVLNYERLLALAPDHPDAAANLKFVREQSGGRVAEPQWYETAIGVIPARLSPWLAIGLAWCGWAWAGSAIIRRTGIAGVIGGTLLVLMGAGYGMALLWDGEVRANDAIVLDKVDARREPADRAALADSLGAGSEVRVLSEQGEWTFALLPSGQKGWLKSGSIDLIIPSKHR